ncbi:MAG: PilZ domain-containing protein [Candidatus Aminicenantia bacterium]
MKDLQEKRRTLRFAPEKSPETEIEILLDFKIINISQSGILIETSNYLPVNSIHYLKLPGKKKTFSIKGIVKRVEAIKKGDKEFFNLALKFIDLSSEEKESLADFIRHIEQNKDLSFKD